MESEKTPKRVALYYRISTKKEKDEENTKKAIREQSIEMQVRDLRAYAGLRGFTIVKEYADEGISGSIKKRPGLDALWLDARKRAFDIVLVWRFDRFGRNTLHMITALQEFRNLGIDFISFNDNIDTSSPMGEAMFTICSAFAQLERDAIRARVRAGLANAKAKGIRLGKAPVDKIPILELHRKGLNKTQIAKKLKLSRRTIQRVLKYVYCEGKHGQTKT